MARSVGDQARAAARRAGRASLIALMGAALLACSPIVSTHGHRLDDAALAQIQPGRTTRDQVAQLLGSPSATTTFGNDAWYYVSQRTERRSFYQEQIVQQDVVSITFDERGAVRAVERHGLDEARDVQMVGRTTPTVGNELTVLEQFIGNLGRFNAPRGDQGQ
jgi:outer membrane protein assembly factor BamE (lipoprotein component of BamABCDE complex)